MLAFKQAVVLRSRFAFEGELPNRYLLFRSSVSRFALLNLGQFTSFLGLLQQLTLLALYSCEEVSFLV